MKWKSSFLFLVLYVSLFAPLFASPSTGPAENTEPQSNGQDLSLEWQNLKLKVKLLWTDYLTLSEELQKSEAQSGTLLMRVEELEAESANYRRQSEESTVLSEELRKENDLLRKEKSSMVKAVAISGAVGFLVGGLTVAGIVFFGGGR